MSFFFLGNVDFNFEMKGFTVRLLTNINTLSTTSRVQLIDEHEFAKTALDENSKTFVVHVAALKFTKMTIHPSRVD